MRQNRMFRIGLTGGIGTGKSKVLAFLSGRGDSAILEADRLAKELYIPGNSAYQPVVEAFGREILDAGGEIDRKKLGQIVFSDPEKLVGLNEIVHPLVKEEILERMDKAEKDGKRFFFLEAALLLQDGYREICDEIWYIYADREVRLKRLMTGRGIGREDALRVMNSQPDEDWYRERTDRKLDNSGEFEKTEEEIRNCLSDLLFSVEE